MSGPETQGANAPDGSKTTTTPVVQLPTYLETAREWYRSGGVQLSAAADWLVSQGDPNYPDRERAIAAISQ